MLVLTDIVKDNFVLIPECPLCDSDKFRAHFVRNDIEYVNCNCGMVFQPMYMTSEQISEYYMDAYRTKSPSSGIGRERMRGKRQIRLLNGITPKRHLDIGSSTGVFVKLVKEKYGCESIGVEPNDIFRDYSIKSGINTVADISEVDGKFDFISMSHVLEHLVDPLEMLETVMGLLEDDGHLFVEVPIMCPSVAHPLMFFELTLEKMLNKAGFKVIEIPKDAPLMVLAKKGD